MLRPRGSAAAKANATCQKCLMKGHWTFECKNEQGTYQVRPSATKQLKTKRLRQPFMEEEAPAVPKNESLGVDRTRYGEDKVNLPPPEKKQKTKEKKKKKG